MKIAVWHNLGSGGAKRALFGHVKGLQLLGHDLEVWCPPSADDSYLPLKDLVPTHVLPWSQRTERPLGRSLRLMRFGITPARDGLTRHLESCAKEIEQRGFDIVLGNSCRRYYASGIGMYTTLPSALYLQEPNRRLHEAFPESLWAAPKVELERFAALRTLWGQAVDAVQLREARIALRSDGEWVKSFDQVLVNSHFSRESILRSYGIDSRVCYLGVDLDFFKPSDRRRMPYAIGVGAISPAKGIDFAIRALSLLPPEFRKLVWVANTERKEHTRLLHSLAASLDVALDIRMMVDDSELAHLLQGARLMVCTSVLEPFGYAPIEALACGTPVVAVGEGGFRESVDHMKSGILVGRSEEDFAAAVNLAYQDPTLCQDLGRRGRQRVEAEFSLSAAARRLENELARLIDQ